MATELRSLRIDSDFSATKYVAGMNQKISADKAGAASSDEVGAAVVRTDTKVSNAGDVLARLSRQYVDGYASAQRFNSAITSLGRGIETGRIQMAQAIPILDGIYRRYGMTANAAELAERGQIGLAKAVSEANTRISAQAAIAERAANANQRLGANSNLAGRRTNDSGASNFQSGNIAAQIQDIVVSAQMGQSLQTITLQQGSQLAAVANQLGTFKEAGQSLMQAVMGLASPLSLAALGFTAAAAAGIQYFTSTKNTAKETDDLLKTHETNIKRLRDAWGSASEERSKYGRISTDSAAFGVENNLSALTKKLQEANQGEISQNILSAVNTNRAATGMTAREFRGTTLFKALQIDFEELQKATIKGSPDVLGIIRNLESIGRDSPNAGIKAIVASAVAGLQPFKELAEAIREARLELNQLFNDRGPNGMLLSRGPSNLADMGNLALYESRNKIAAQRQQAAFDADMQAMRARSPSERIAAVRAQETATYNEDEDPTQRRTRINSAALREQLTIEHELAEAKRDRVRALDATLGQQQLELELIGKTAAEADALRMQYEQIQQLKEDAYRNGTSVDEQEIALIKEKTEAYARLAEQISRANLTRDLQFESEQRSRSAQDQAIATRLKGAGLPVDLQSNDAAMIRAGLQDQERRDALKGFFTDFGSSLRASGGDLGKAFGESILNAANRSLDKMMSRLVDGLVNAVLGTGTGATASGGSSVVSGLLGGGVSAANDNMAAPLANVVRMPLPATGGGVQSQVWNFFKGKGLADHQVAGILGNVKAESSFNPLAVGDSGQAFGLFQHNDRKNNLFNAIGGKGNLGDVNGQLNFAWKELQTSENPAFKRLLSSSNVREATAAFGGFERPRGFSVANPEGMHNWTGRLEGAEQALEKFGGTATAATENLGGFGTSLTKATDSLITGSTGAPGGGGLAGLLGSGAGGTGTGVNYFPPAPAAPTGGGGGILGAILGFLPKMFGFANGTDYAPGGLARINELGGEIVDLPRGSRVIPHDISKRMASAPRAVQTPQTSGKTELHVHVSGASGDAHVRMLAKQGAQEVLAEHNENQRRGGFGTIQQRFSSQKG